MSKLTKKQKKGTYIKITGGGQVCPRCKKETFGYKSQSKAFDGGELVQKYQMRTSFCTSCAYVEGDVL